MGTQNIHKGILKVFLDPPPPLERESFAMVVELTIPKVTNLSTQKRDCEKYHF